MRRRSMKPSQGHSRRATHPRRCQILTSMMRRAAASNQPANRARMLLQPQTELSRHRYLRLIVLDGSPCLFVIAIMLMMIFGFGRSTVFAPPASRASFLRARTISGG